MNGKTPFHLTGRTILVTGASSGIGRECCVQIAAMGGRVIATGRNAERLNETMESLAGEGHLSIQGDLYELATSGRLVSSLPPLDGVVHSAGLMKILPLKFLTEKLLRDIAQVNYEAPALISQQMLKHKSLRPGASIIFISSVAAQVATKGNSAYSATKGALCSFARVFALEVASLGIRVNTISPGQVITPLLALDGSISETMLTEYKKLYPLGFGQPVDVAYGAVYLLSDASRWLTGTDLVMDGGYTLA